MITVMKEYIKKHMNPTIPNSIMNIEYTPSASVEIPFNN